MKQASGHLKASPPFTPTVEAPRAHSRRPLAHHSVRHRRLGVQRKGRSLARPAPKLLSAGPQRRSSQARRSRFCKKVVRKGKKIHASVSRSKPQQPHNVIQVAFRPRPPCCTMRVRFEAVIPLIPIGRQGQGRSRVTRPANRLGAVIHLLYPGVSTEGEEPVTRPTSKSWRSELCARPLLLC